MTPVVQRIVVTASVPEGMWRRAMPSGDPRAQEIAVHPNTWADVMTAQDDDGSFIVGLGASSELLPIGLPIIFEDDG